MNNDRAQNGGNSVSVFPGGKPGRKPHQVPVIEVRYGFPKT